MRYWAQAEWSLNIQLISTSIKIVQSLRECPVDAIVILCKQYNTCIDLTVLHSPSRQLHTYNHSRCNSEAIFILLWQGWTLPLQHPSRIDHLTGNKQRVSIVEGARSVAPAISMNRPARNVNRPICNVLCLTTMLADRKGSGSESITLGGLTHTLY